MTRSPRLVDDCFQSSEALISHDVALEQLKAQIVPVTGTEPVPLAAANLRILADDITASFNVPGHNNAAVDGFAFRHRDLTTDGKTDLHVVGRSAAGQPFTGTVDTHQAIRILTGAVVPDTCDSVIMQEDVVLAPDGNTVTVPADARKGANIRPVGEDIAANSVVLSKGHVLRPQDLATLASIGVGSPKCFAKLKVGIISTGDEIVGADSGPLAIGHVFDANTPMLSALVANAGCEVHELGIWPDKADVVRDRLQDAAETFDVLITSGGASQGEEDHMARTLGELGQRHFWRIAVKPGRPLMFGQINGTPVVGLPGNPVAVFVCFLMYVFPILRRLSGAPFPTPRRVFLPADFAVEKRKPGRREFWRGRLVATGTGLAVKKFPKDGSGLISSLRESDGLIDMPEDVPTVRPGDQVAFIPYSEFGILS